MCASFNYKHLYQLSCMILKGMKDHQIKDLNCQHIKVDVVVLSCCMLSATYNDCNVCFNRTILPLLDCILISHLWLYLMIHSHPFLSCAVADAMRESNAVNHSTIHFCFIHSTHNNVSPLTYTYTPLLSPVTAFNSFQQLSTFNIEHAILPHIIIDCLTTPHLNSSCLLLLKLIYIPIKRQ